jgi:hypothetical protein
MKHKILHIDDSNIVGEWSYTFFLSQEEGQFVLTLDEVPTEEYCLDAEPVCGLQTGIDVYRALGGILTAAGYGPEDIDLESISAAIAEVDRDLAAQFRGAPEEIERRGNEARQLEAARERAVLEPLAERIDAYVTARFSDERLHYPGAGRIYPSQRFWAKCFIQQHVLEHGPLPTGRHWIRVSGFSGGEHDFSDLNP